MSDNQNDDKTQSFIALTAGTTIKHYKIIEKIGSGGMGEVYLAEMSLWTMRKLLAIQGGICVFKIH